MGVFGPSYNNIQPAKPAETPDFIGAARTQTMNNIANKNRQQQKQMEILRGTADIGGKAWDKYDKYKTANPDGSIGQWAKGGFGSGAAPAAAAPVSEGALMNMTPGAAGQAMSTMTPTSTVVAEGAAGGGGAMAGLASNPVGWAALAALAAWSFMDNRES